MSTGERIETLEARLRALTDRQNEATARFVEVGRILATDTDCDVGALTAERRALRDEIEGIAANVTPVRAAIESARIAHARVRLPEIHAENKRALEQARERVRAVIERLRPVAEEIAQREAEARELPGYKPAHPFHGPDGVLRVIVDAALGLPDKVPTLIARDFLLQEPECPGIEPRLYVAGRVEHLIPDAHEWVCSMQYGRRASAQEIERAEREEEERSLIQRAQAIGLTREDLRRAGERGESFEALRARVLGRS